ncbi:MAG: hypothetical protein U9P49_09415, partial [Thermodesulfobacteriota bacterium]|nr:hypothetical protein [Thermodesulfobacteriota bacterium]
VTKTQNPVQMVVRAKEVDVEKAKTDKRLKSQTERRRAESIVKKTRKMDLWATKRVLKEIAASMMP